MAATIICLGTQLPGGWFPSALLEGKVSILVTSTQFCLEPRKRQKTPLCLFSSLIFTSTHIFAPEAERERPGAAAGPRGRTCARRSNQLSRCQPPVWDILDARRGCRLHGAHVTKPPAPCTCSGLWGFGSTQGDCLRDLRGFW